MKLYKNQELECKVERIGYHGEGIAQVESMVVFIRNSIPGDHLKIKIIKLKKNFAIARIQEIIKPSKHRIKPICINNRCGGCQLGFVDYYYQLEIKKIILENAFKQNANLENFNFLSIKPSQKFEYYRNKVIFPVNKIDDKIKIGFYAARSHEIISAQGCKINPEITESIINIVKSFFEKNNISIYNEKKHSGNIRNICIRVNENESEVMVIFIIKENNIPNIKSLIDDLTVSIPVIKSIKICKNNKKSNVVLTDKIKTVYGNEFITANINKIKYLINANTFFQVNYEQTQHILNYIKSITNKIIDTDKIIFDLYGGIGTIGIYLNKFVKKIYCFESNKNSIDTGIKTCRLNNISNVEFIHRDSYAGVIDYFENIRIIPNIVLLDPPRKGCSKKLIELIAKYKISNIIYVSCNPATLARDIKIFNDSNYYLDSIKGFDMFPYTYHIETVTHIKKANE